METNTEVLPQHQHDCSHCVFLGRLGTGDLYYHASPESGATYMVRYSSNDSDYYSSADFKDRHFNSLHRTVGLSSREDRELLLRRITAIAMCPVGILNLMDK